MNTPSLMLVDPPELSDETVSEVLDCLYQLATAFENQYANQLRRYYQTTEPPQPDLFEYFDDELPDF
jgi:hypothetical protein